MIRRVAWWTAGTLLYVAAIMVFAQLWSPLMLGVGLASVGLVGVAVGLVWWLRTVREDVQWSPTYTGNGAGTLGIDGAQARWVDEPRPFWDTETMGAPE